MMWAWTLITAALMLASALAGAALGKRRAAPLPATPGASSEAPDALEHLRRDHEHMAAMVRELLERQQHLHKQLRAAQAAPDTDASSHDKGAAFERAIVLAMDWQALTLEEWRSDKEVAGIAPASSCYPDLELTARAADGALTRLAVECKWRARASAREEVTWCTARQLKTYQRFAREHEQPVFVALGLGGAPDQPDALYLAPLDALPSPTASLRQLKPYRHPPNTPITYHAAMRRLGAP